jgi:hypothetical protein
MTVAATTAPGQTDRLGHDPTRLTALVAGLIYLVTFLASIPAALLLSPAPIVVAAMAASGFAEEQDPA